MSVEIELWSFVARQLRLGEQVMLLIVAESSGSSPGRAGYKMAIAGNGELCGSIGGGVMEMRFVDDAKNSLSQPPASLSGAAADVGQDVRCVEKVHRKDATNASGMICSGRQTVIMKRLDALELRAVDDIIASLAGRERSRLTISPKTFSMTADADAQVPTHTLDKRSETDFIYTERLGKKNDLYMVGGGHCSLALSELMSRMDFNIHIFDDRPDLNTIEKNAFADEIKIIDSYDEIGSYIPTGNHSYVVVMTVGYASDEVVIRSLLGKELKYIGVLGSRAKMSTLLKQLRDEGFSAERLERLHTPIGIPINSHTPQEIAVSIAAEIIAVMNA